MKTPHASKRARMRLGLAVAVSFLSAAGPVMAGGYSSTILSDRPYAYFRFDDPSGNEKDVAADATGAHNGAYFGKPALVSDTPGVMGGTSLKIPVGTPDSYVTANLASLGSLLGKGVTFEFWIKTKDTRTGKRIFGSFNTGSNTTVTVASNSNQAYTATVGSTQVFMRKQGSGDYAAAFNQSVANIYDGNWHHVVWTAENMEKPVPDPFRVYVDGVQVPLTYGATWTSATFANFDNPFYIGHAGRAAPLVVGGMFEGQLDEFVAYDRVLTKDQVLKHYQAAWTAPALASDPRPRIGATDVTLDMVLSWAPGESALTHDVYFGTTPVDVGAASRTNPLGVLVSQGQDPNTYQPSGLELGQTYYWRVDEITAPPSQAISKGEVWSFTMEPVALALSREHITATASSRNSADEGPEKTINGSGLDANDLHSIDPTNMWLSAAVGAGESAWIRYEFDKVYALHQMQVWNHNTVTEPLIGLGIKGAIIEYSLDGTAWTSLGAAQEFTRAPGKGGYASNTTISLGGVAAKFVRITAVSNWGGVLKQYGLSEARFLYIPVFARQPSPASGTADLPPQLILSWRSGRQAASHRVYFGSSEPAVTKGTAPVVTVSKPSFDTDTLVLGRSYYWKVNEVNEAKTPSIWPGDVWTFSTQEYLAVDDFESYTDDLAAQTTIFDTWVDGYADGFKSSGSTVGNDPAPFAERTIVHGGKQSMPMQYDNTKAPFYSEAVRTFDKPQDWTVYGADSLRLSFRGRPVTFIERSPGNIVMSAAGTDIFGLTDEFRFVYQQLAGNGTIIARVESLDNTHAWAKAGVMIRESLEVGAKHAMVVITPGNGVSFQKRVLSNDVSTYTARAGVQTPVWLRLTRTGEVFKAEHSTDGKTWSNVGADAGASSATMVLSGTAYIGLALTSHSAGVLATAQFSNVSTTGTVSGGWKTAEIGVDHPGNDPARLYVAVQDSGGRSKVVSHSDPEATDGTAWQTWRIPLSDFSKAGVKINSIRKTTIGVGDRDNPAAGGTGLIYIDDIGFGRPFDTAPPVDPAPVVTGSYNSLVLADRPYAYYRFDDASSNDKDTAADAMGGHNGTYVGKPSLVSDAAGTIGGTSLKIPIGTPDSYVTARLTSLGSLLGKGVTFEFWIKTKDTRTGKRILGTFNTGSNTSVSVASNSGPAYQATVGSTQVFLRKQGGGDYGAAFNQSVVNLYDGNWHHVVWTADNMAKPAANPYRVYVDGVQVPLTYGATWTSAAFADFENPFYIAHAGRAAPLVVGGMFEGQLDEFAAYDHLLTEEQILNHYRAAVPALAK